jgi:para-nitrobenzyl esterase
VSAFGTPAVFVFDKEVFFMRKLLAAAAIALVLLPAIASAQTTAPAGAATTYSTSSTVGDLLANPDAKAVLVKDAPGLVTDQLSMAASMTLVSLQQYAPQILTDATLAQINTDLAKVPVK